MSLLLWPFPTSLNTLRIVREQIRTMMLLAKALWEGQDEYQIFILESNYAFIYSLTNQFLSVNSVSSMINFSLYSELLSNYFQQNLVRKKKKKTTVREEWIRYSYAVLGAESTIAKLVHKCLTSFERHTVGEKYYQVH